MGTSLPTYNAFKGRLVLAGRTGGNNQNCHIDNIHLVTLPATNAVLLGIEGLLNGFKFTIEDQLPSVLTNVTSAKFDGVETVTNPNFHVSYSLTNGDPNGDSVGIYTQAVRLTPSSVHTISLAWLDSFGVNSFGNFTFTVPPWFELPATNALPLSAVDQTQPGFLILPYQTVQFNPNQMRWTEELVAGLHGSNIKGPAVGLTGDSTGALIWDGPLDFANLSAAPANPGGGFFPNNDTASALSSFGIGANYPGNSQNLHAPSDNCALEIFSYVYFPTSGVYNLVIGSDDGYQLSVAGNPRDRMGTVLQSLNGSLLPNSALNLSFAAIHPAVVNAPGVYPIRLLWDNGVGNAGIEVYTAPSFGTTAVPGGNAFLLNDTNNTASGAALASFRALAAGQTAPPYVRRAVPVRDAMDVLYNQPVVVDLSDGTGLTVNSGTLALTIDGIPSGITTSPLTGGIRLKQVMTNNWTVGLHTNVLGFQDSGGGPHSYTWSFTVMGTAVNGALLAADPTNTPARIPLANRVDPGTLSTPGFIFNSHQMLFKEPNVSGTAEEEFMNLRGSNIATAFGTSTFNLDTPMDFRFSSGNATYAGGAAGEWAFDNSLKQFGFVPVLLNSAAQNIDNCALEIGCYLNFPAAGNYLMNVNSDDGFKVTSPNSRYLFDKIGTRLGFADVGRGISGPPGGAPTGGTLFMVNVPQAGAYPFRLIWENGGGDAALEWSVYVPQADGTVVHELINDPSAPVPILASQASSVQPGPYVSFVSPAPNSQDNPWYSPAVVRVTDGPALTTDETKIVSLSEDGVAQTFTASKAGSVTTVMQTLNTPHVFGRVHTNVLVFTDSSNNRYTNEWAYNVFGTGQGSDSSTPNTIAPYNIINVPASLSVPIASLDLTQPGFRLRSYQTTAGQANTVQWTEEQIVGLHGPNIADQTGAGAGGYWVWTNMIDFSITPGGGANASSAEWNYDFPLTNWDGFFDNNVSPLLFGNLNVPPSNFGFQTNPAGTTIQMNNQTLTIGAYLVFQRNGTYIMAVPSDDCFKLTIPYGDPFNVSGLLLGDCNAGRGSSGAGFGSRGGMTYCPFVITNAPAAFPVRLLWENGGGGGGVEWSCFQPMSDGTVNYVMVNDPLNPESIKAYQTTTNPAPYVAFMGSVPALAYGSLRIDTTLAGNGLAQTVTNNGPVQQDYVFGFTNYQSEVNTNAPMSLTYKGIPQPFVLSVSNGMLLVTRPANDPQWWPSGAVGPLVFNWQDSVGVNHSTMLGRIATPFWGTLASGSVTLQDQNSPGLKMRTYAVDGMGVQDLNNRIHQAEQTLAGYYGPNLVDPSKYPTNLTVGGYWIYPGTSPADTNGGVFNFAFLNSPDGDFRPATYPEHPWPGIPSLATVNKQNDFVAEFLAYVTFPSNGVYTLGVASDDGFRLTKGWNPPAHAGEVVINSPASLAGPIGSEQHNYIPDGNFYVTNPITADLVVAYGPYTTSTNAPFAPPNEFGSTNFQGLGFSVDGCIINDSVNLAGKVALVFRSPYCGFQQKTALAQSKGAVGIVLVDYPTAYTNGAPSRLPVEATVNTPPLSIPMVTVRWADGLKLLASAQTNVPNVTLTPLDFVVDPPADNPVLGQADFGKGASDILFPVVVQAAGTYPLRLSWFQGGGGASCELFSVVNGNRILVNDVAGGSPLKAFYALSTVVTPPLKIVNNGNGTVTITFGGTLQSETDLNSHSWANVTGATSPWTVSVPQNATPVFYRAKSP